MISRGILLLAKYKCYLYGEKTQVSGGFQFHYVLNYEPTTSHQSNFIVDL